MNVQPTPLRNERTTDADAFGGVGLLRLALEALEQRVLLWCVAILAGVMWMMAVARPEPWRLIAVAGYSVFVLIPFLWKDGRR